MQYRASLKALFVHPKWFTQLLLQSVCTIIPLVGPIVLIGYYTKVFAVQHQNPAAVYPDFDFDDLFDYLKLGVWPLVCGLVVSLIALPLMVIAMIPAILIVPLELREPEAFYLAGASAFLYLLFVLLMMIVTLPAFLHAGLSQSMSLETTWPFVKDFVKRMWGTIIIMYLFTWLISIPITLAGYAMCGIGLYPAMAFMMFTVWQLYRQLYAQYLERGGMSIEIAPVLLAE